MRTPINGRPSMARPTAAVSDLEDDFSPNSITADAAPYPDRICLYAPPKWGKTAWAAEAEDAVFLMTRGEDGLLTLKKSGVVRPDVRCFPRCAESWNDVCRALTGLIQGAARPKTLVIDTLNGCEQLCHQHVCQTQYGGDWSEKGFMSFQVGYRTASPKEFERLLDLIDRLRELGTSVICLCHAAVKTRKNPKGPDFDAYAPALHEKTWEITARRFDVLLFGTFEAFITKAHSRATKGKVEGGDRRIIYAQPSGAHEAGGRYALPPEIDCGTSAAEAWAAFQQALTPVGLAGEGQGEGAGA